MKPIKLEIEGLNSFESNQVLDFDQLGDGVFGIFGNTGSGKSTILDAITLALYGKVERSKQQIEFINIKKQKARVKLTFDINQNGKKRIYEVERTFSAKKNTKTIDSSAALFEIINNERKLIEEGTVKVNDKIFKIIGLGVNEFAKCIALPQGAFSAFLQAKPSERIEIMSNIFNLSKYGDRLSFAVKERLNICDKDVSILSANKDMLKLATDEAVENQKHEFEFAKQKFEEKSAKQKLLQEELSKAQKAIEKQDSLSKINEELGLLEKEKDEISKLEEFTLQAQNANEMKTDFLKFKKTQIDEKELSDKIADMNELRIKKQTELDTAGQEFSVMKDIYETKIIELNKKITVLEELESSDGEVEKLRREYEKLKIEISETQKVLSSEQENNAYFEGEFEKIKKQIDEIDLYIAENKPKVDKVYALEQVKDVESEFILIEDFHDKLSNFIDSLQIELAESEKMYNEAIASEKNLKEKQENIKKTFKVAFESDEVEPIEKLRACDKELLAFEDAQNLVSHFENLIAKLEAENAERVEVIGKLKVEIEKANHSLAEYERAIDEKSLEVEDLAEERESLLGENVISLISDNLKIGDFCPVCSSRVIQKIYSEKNNLSQVEAELIKQKGNYKSMVSSRDKLFADVVSLKIRLEFEKTQIKSNDDEISALKFDISKIYQKFVDNNDKQKENFEKLKSLIIETSTKLEDLVIMQDRLRDELLSVIISKSQSGTKVSLIKAELEPLLNILYDLQKKKAEREFILLNSNSELSKIDDYKKFVADGKNLEIELDESVKRKQKLRDDELRLMQEKGDSDRKILSLKSTIQMLMAKQEGDEKQISNLLSKAQISGVPEGVSVADEKMHTKSELEKLKNDYLEKQSIFETKKEEFSRIENDYKINISILRDKQNEMNNLKNIIQNNMVKFNFKSEDDVEKLFVENVEIKQNIEKINNFNNKLKILISQKEELEKDLVAEVDREKLEKLKQDTESLNDEIKLLSEQIGKAGAKFEDILNNNKKLKEIEENLVVAQKKYDTAKELSSVLRGKALAEYFCEEYLDEITESANSKLELLMDGRYKLRFEDKEFFVEDNFSDGVVRPANTLSGGETFIVSLSLALSISDAIAMLSSRSIDFFFLDEGFGTLDSELCSVVISALHKLESQNLKIGLISHIAELAEAIKNKVVVTKDANGSKIRIEHSL